MKTILLRIFIILITFILMVELISYISTERRFMSTIVEGFTHYDKNNKNDVYFIGDSYAQTIYANESYPLLFRDYFKERNWNFIDLSTPGSTIKQHKPILDSLSGLNPKLIIYFYHISNSVFLKDVAQKPIPSNKADSILLAKKKNNKIKKQNKNFSLNALISSSATVLLFKKISQFLSLQFTDRYYPGTLAYRAPKNTLKYKNEIEDYFNSIQAENVLIFVNTPFAAGAKVKKWEQYEVFKAFDRDNAFKLIQSVDIIDDPDYSLSWRNNHPNQEAIKIIADSLIKHFDNIK